MNDENPHPTYSAAWYIDNALASFRWFILPDVTDKPSATYIQSQLRRALKALTETTEQEQAQ